MSATQCITATYLPCVIAHLRSVSCIGGSLPVRSCRVTSRSEKAVALFQHGYNCAQATLGAFAEDFGIDFDLAARMTAGLGSGRAGRRETCGPVNAMAIIVGLGAGSLVPDDLDAKKNLYARVRAMEAEFLRVHGSTCCRELLLRAGIAAGPDPSPRTPEYYLTRPCSRLVATAADIVSAMLERSEARRPPSKYRWSGPTL